MTNHPTHCVFEHAGFALLQDASFRLTKDDRLPALVLQLDGSQAVLPFPAVFKLFTLSADGADGRMLGLVASALRFVNSIRPGDPLPTEVLSGQASWTPSDYHRQIASARLQFQLVTWLGGTQDGNERQITPEMLVASADDPAIRNQVHEALRHAASELGVPGGEAVATLIEELATEIAYIEALREGLLVRVQTILRRLHRLSASNAQLSAARRETLFQVTRLTGVGLAEITARFDQVDAQTGEILPALRNLERQRNFLRPNRDWLYCTQLAWAAELKDWDQIGSTETGERVWKLLDRLYRFVAPRFMAVQEWQSLNATTTQRAKAVLVW